jgi:hypothetical protein
MPERIDPKRARQGRKGRPVLLVLIAALVLALIAWGVAEIFGEATDPANPAGEIETTEPGAEEAIE